MQQEAGYENKGGGIVWIIYAVKTRMTGAKFNKRVLPLGKLDDTY